MQLVWHAGNFCATVAPPAAAAGTWSNQILVRNIAGGASFEHEISAVAPWIEIKSLVKNQWETFRFLGV